METIIKEYKGLVKSIACRYVQPNQPYEDLFQEGMLGLVAALKDYDASRGYKFSTYATWRIRGRIQQYCRDKCDMIRVPRTKNRMAVYCIDDINSGYPAPEVDINTKVLVRQYIDCLNPEEKQVITGIFLYNKQQKYIACEMGIPQSKVSILRFRGLRNLYRYMSSA